MRRASGGVRKRGATWWLRYYVNGVRVEESAQTGDERAARALLAQRRREIANGTWQPAATRAQARLGNSVAAYLTDWLERREASGVRGVRNERRFLNAYVIPQIGTMALCDVRRSHVRELVAKVTATTSERTKQILSSRTVLHVYQCLSTALNDAVLEERLASSPCTLRARKGELPKKRDKDPAWRAHAVYTREEAVTLLSSPEVPLDRRALYALQLVGGLRANEAVGRRWRDYDADAVPLGRLTVATQADGAKGERATKTEDVRVVPVHPTLAAILAEWKLAFPVLFGRFPRPEDPICPSRGDLKGASSFRVATYSRLVDDVEMLGLRRVPALQHAMRATFLTLLSADGADMRIAMRATHRPPGDVVSGYIRVQWADLCREIGKLNLERRTGVATVATLPVRREVSGGTNGDNRGDRAPASTQNPEESQQANRWAMLDLKLDTGADPAAISGASGRGPRDVPSDRPQNASVAIHEMQRGTQGWGQPAVAADLAARVLALDPEALARVAAMLEGSAGLDLVRARRNARRANERAALTVAGKRRSDAVARTQRGSRRP